MNIDSKEFVEQLKSISPPKEFKPLPVYSHVGDMLKLYWNDEPGYAVTVNEFVTLIVGFTTKSVVGVKITGILQMVNSKEGNP